MPYHPDNFYETSVLPPGEFDGHAAEEGCVADLTFAQFSEVDVDQLAALQAAHVLVDVDGTVMARYSSSKDVIDEATLRKLREIEHDPRFDTVSLATENGGHPEGLRRCLGMSATAAVFQKFDIGKLGTAWKTTESYWKRILYTLDCLDEPEKVVIIGDSVVRDIATPRLLGMKTVLVGRHQRR